MGSEWRTINEAATDLRCSRSFVNTLLGKRSGRPVILPSFMHANKRYILSKDIEAFRANVEAESDRVTQAWRDTLIKRPSAK